MDTFLHRVSDRTDWSTQWSFRATSRKSVCLIDAKGTCLPCIFLVSDKRNISLFPFTSAHLVHLYTYYMVCDCVVYVSFCLNFTCDVL